MKSALIVIDVQKKFINDVTRHLPGKISDFITNKGNQFDYLIFFKFQNISDSNWFNILNWQEMIYESEIELAPEILPHVSKAIVFRKKAAFSIFRVKEFIHLLKTKDISKLFLCGMDTHACVYTSAMEAFERGFDIKIIEDLCVASHGQNYHQHAIKALTSNLSSKVVLSTNNF